MAQFIVLKDRIKNQEHKIARCDDMLLNREIDKEAHQPMTLKLKEEIAVLRKKIELQESSETGFMKYCRFAIPLLSNLSGFYMHASIAIKQKLLGSIFPAKLHFREDSYRTTPLNPALALISQKNNGLENKKTRQNLFHKILSGGLPKIGLEPTHLAAPEPKSGVSTNFTTWAVTCKHGKIFPYFFQLIF